MRAVAIVNAEASAVLEAGPSLAEDIARRFLDQGTALELLLAGPGEIGNAVRRAAARHDIDAVIVGGGDGSQSLAASLLAGTGKALGVLPLGTVNLLARDLDVPLDMTDAVDALAHARVAQVDLGELNGRTFHSIAGLGFPARMARERQRARRAIPFARWLAFLLALIRALARIDRMSLVIETGTGRVARRCSALLVTNNIYRETEWTRRRMSDGLLEVHIVSGWAWPPLAWAGFDVVLGRWRQSGRIESILAREVVISTRRPRVAVSIDGEVVYERSPLVFRVRRGALKVLEPLPRAPASEA
ncbi:MAG: diacylglycerol kinase [Hyphomicrobiaceae bacterium]|nr:diacylglycerol kinase [Hyphomicrobiaceae bacterium]